jgi:2-desacetyl-2-hydroxyethyl bacteriochlorophyllide A dehydrogenase
MRALVLTGVEQLEVRDVPEPPTDQRALIAVERAGLCGTDLKLHLGKPPVDYPRILGHEVIGRVVQPGASRRVAEGTRVLVDPAIACGHCHACLADRPNLCPRGALMGREVDGGFADLVAVDDRQLLALPSSMSLPDAAMLQVLGVCVHAQRRVNVFPGQTAAVIGLGVGGLLHTQLLTARGVRVVGITRSSGKQELAESLGAVVACGPDEAVECIGDVTDGRGVDVVVESVGTTETLAQAIDLVTVGGTVLQYGILAATEGRLPFYELYYKEIDLVNSRAAVPGDYAASIDLVASGQVEVASLISETYTLEQGADAFDAMHSRSDLIKVLLEIG